MDVFFFAASLHLMEDMPYFLFNKRNLQLFVEIAHFARDRSHLFEK